MARVETTGSPLYLFRTVSGYRNKFSPRHLHIRKQSSQRTGLENEQEKERNTSGRGATPKKNSPIFRPGTAFGTKFPILISRQLGGGFVGS